MRRRAAVVLLGLLVGSCGPGSSASGPSTSSVPAASIAAVTSAPPSTAAAPVPTAAAATTTTSRAPAPTVLDVSDDATATRFLADLTVLLAAGPRVSGSPAEEAAGEYLQTALADLIGVVFSEDVPLSNGASSRNIWTGFGTGDTEILLGAHYDSIAAAPGADDNGSGTVVLLELARRLAAAPYPGFHVTVVFFGAEEILAGYARDEHHFGSRLMAARLEAAGVLPDWMVSIDMVGVGAELYAVTYKTTDPAAADLLVAAAAVAGVDVSRMSRGDISDHEAFARRGVPAAFLWRPDNPDYHRSGDDHVDVVRLLEDLAVIEAFLVAAGS